LVDFARGVAWTLIGLACNVCAGAVFLLFIGIPRRTKTTKLVLGTCGLLLIAGAFTLLIAWLAASPLPGPEIGDER